MSPLNIKIQPSCPRDKNSRLATGRMVKTLLVGLMTFLVTGPLWACPQSTDQQRSIPRDNYFTLETATKKVQQQYPFAKPVPAVLLAGVREKKNLVYSRIGQRDLHIDVFEPADSGVGNRPCLLLVHGGAWRSGDKSMEWPLAMHIAHRGYVTATVEYRLTPEARYPAAVHDLKTALRWLRKEASTFRIDTNRIAVSGCSSGGHLATLMGATNSLPAFEGNGEWQAHSSSVHAIVNIEGDVDLTESDAIAKDTMAGQLSSEARWLGGSFAQIPETWREASAYYHVSRAMPPILFLNSSLPNYHAGRDKMVRALNDYGVPVTLVTLPDTPHAFWLFFPWFDRTVNTVAGFLKTVFK
jgi:acetyl esterase/lipase